MNPIEIKIGNVKGVADLDQLNIAVDLNGIDRNNMTGEIELIIKQLNLYLDAIEGTESPKKKTVKKVEKTEKVEPKIIKTVNDSNEIIPEGFYKGRSYQEIVAEDIEAIEYLKKNGSTEAIRLKAASVLKEAV
jgi:hypothetical protein